MGHALFNANGFHRRGRMYVRVSGGWIHAIEYQKSQFRDGFFLNVGCQPDYAPIPTGETADAFPGPHYLIFNTRLENVVEGLDWVTVLSPERSNAIQELSAILDKAVKWLIEIEARLTPEDLLDPDLLANLEAVRPQRSAPIDHPKVLQRFDGTKLWSSWEELCFLLMHAARASNLTDLARTYAIEGVRIAAGDEKSQMLFGEYLGADFDFSPYQVEIDEEDFDPSDW